MNYEIEIGRLNTRISKLSENTIPEIIVEQDKVNIKVEQYHQRVHALEEGYKLVKEGFKTVERVLIGDLNEPDKPGIIKELRDVCDEVKEKKKKRIEWWMIIRDTVFAGLIGFLFFLIEKKL